MCSLTQKFSLAMGTLAAMFAVMVVSKIVRDRVEATDLVNQIRTARYEELIAQSPPPGLGEL